MSSRLVPFLLKRAGMLPGDLGRVRKNLANRKVFLPAAQAVAIVVRRGRGIDRYDLVDAILVVDGRPGMRGVSEVARLAAPPAGFLMHRKDIKIAVRTSLRRL